MIFDLPAFAAIFTGIAVVLLFELGTVLLAGKGPAGRRMNRRLRLLEANEDGRVVLRKLSRRPVAGDNRDLAIALLEFLPVRVLDHLAGRAGLLTPIEHLLAAMLLSIMAAILALLAMTTLPAGLILLGGPLAVVAGWGGMLYRMGVRRTNRFNEQLPEALILMSRSLRVGHPLSAALSLVAREMPDPLGSELGMVFDEMTYGLDLREALTSLCGRVEGRALRYMAVAISIQYSTGGNLAELLDRLAVVLRDIDRMHRKVKALSAESRLSATILSILPFAVAFGIGIASPGYFDTVMTDPPFRAALWAAFGGIVMGVLIMIRMVNFRF